MLSMVLSVSITIFMLVVACMEILELNMWVSLVVNLIPPGTLTVVCAVTRNDKVQVRVCTLSHNET